MNSHNFFSLSSPLPYAVGGFALCIFLAVTGASPYLGLLILCALIAIYAALGCQDEANDRREVADNSYMLGFLYTLAIIVATLVADPSTAPDKLISAIAIAMATSAVGMLLRIVILSLRQDPKNFFDKEFARLARQLDRLSFSISSSHTATEIFKQDMDLMTEAVQKYRTDLDAEAGHMAEVLDAHAVRSAQSLAGSLAENLNIVEISNRLQSLTDLLGKVEMEMTFLPKASSQTVTGLKGLEEELVAAGGVLSRAVEGFNSLPSAADKTGAGLQGFAERIEAANRRMAEAEAAITRIPDAIQSAAAALADEAGRAQKEQSAVANRSLEQNRQFLNGTVETIRADLAELKKIKESYREEFKKAADAALEETHKIYATLIQGAGTILSAGNVVDLESLEKLIQAMQRIAVALEARSDAHPGGQ